jgi:two-component system NtrC family sensor kinase
VSQSNANVLLIDDSPVAVEVITATIAEWGITCRVETTGSDGIAAFEKEKFDAVLLDIGLPDVGGLQVLSRLRTLCADIPVIMLTSYGEIDCVLTAIRHGAFDYVTKDEEIELPLRAALDRALTHQRLVRHNHSLLSQLEAEHAQLHDAVAALKRTQTQLVQAERMAAVGVLTAGVAHELNNPLAYIMPSMEVLADFCERASTKDSVADAEARQMVSQCRSGLKRIRRVVETLSVFARPAEGTLGPVDLEVIVGKTILQLRERYDPRLVRTRIAIKETGPVAANALHLQKILLHLLNNAAEAITTSSRGGEISVTTRKRGHRIQLRVVDDGEGITAEDLPRVFDPFFTTKAPGESSGLGLAVSRSMLEFMGGTIEIVSTRGEGTTVTVTLPLYDDVMAGNAF